MHTLVLAIREERAEVRRELAYECTTIGLVTLPIWRAVSEKAGKVG